jgi:hypothetical protein
MALLKLNLNYEQKKHNYDKIICTPVHGIAKEKAATFSITAYPL